MIELHRAAEIAHTFDDVSKKEFGGAIALPKSQTLTSPQTLNTQSHATVPGAELVPLKANFDRLTKMAGSIFGLLVPKGKKLAIYPGVITSRTTPSSLHFTYLNDPINPQNIRNGLTPLQQTMLKGGLDIQDKSVGSTHSHSTVSKTATELGHTAMAVRALTDESTMHSLTNGQHIAHDWSHAQSGIAPVITERSATKPGMFDLATNDGSRNIDFGSQVLTKDSNAMLIQASSFTEQPSAASEVQESKLMIVGLGLLAAQQLHGNATQDKMLRAMDKI